jgi:hypothetical protein
VQGPTSDAARPDPVGPPSITASPLPDRTCGRCNGCCVTLRIDAPELRKEAGVPCPNLTPAGCGIYETLPRLCRGYHCLWRMSAELPDLARPDRCGVIFSLVKPDWGFGPEGIAAVAMHSPDDHQHPAVRLVLARLVASAALPVFLIFKEARTRYFPDDELADAIHHPETTPHRHLLAKAGELRRKWNMTPPPA